MFVNGQKIPQYQNAYILIGNQLDIDVQNALENAKESIIKERHMALKKNILNKKKIYEAKKELHEEGKKGYLIVKEL